MKHARKLIGLVLICAGMAAYAVGGRPSLLLASIPTVLIGVALCPPAPEDRISADMFSVLYAGVWAYAVTVLMAAIAPDLPFWAIVATIGASWYKVVPVAYGFYNGTWPFSAMIELDPVIPAYVPIQGRTMVLSDADMKAAFPSIADRR
jgi:hypothetical protein